VTQPVSKCNTGHFTNLITGSKSNSKERRPDTDAKHAIRGRKSAEWGLTLPL